MFFKNELYPGIIWLEKFWYNLALGYFCRYLKGTESWYPALDKSEYYILVLEKSFVNPNSLYLKTICSICNTHIQMSQD